MRTQLVNIILHSNLLHKSYRLTNRQTGLNNESEYKHYSLVTAGIHTKCVIVLL